LEDLSMNHVSLSDSIALRQIFAIAGKMVTRQDWLAIDNSCAFSLPVLDYL
jgi:hypothetical protein